MRKLGQVYWYGYVAVEPMVLQHNFSPKKGIGEGTGERKEVHIYTMMVRRSDRGASGPGGMDWNKA